MIINRKEVTILNLGARIRKIRKEKDLTQSELGKRIGIKSNSVSLIESGDRNASEQVILSICREFNVNEIWLRTGDGEPFEKLSRDEELATFVGQVIHGEDNFRKRFISALSVLDVDDWEALQKIATKLLEETKKADP